MERPHASLYNNRMLPYIINGATVWSLHLLYKGKPYAYAPKLSYMIDFSSTPRSVSMFTTAFDMGPGPHM